MTFSICEKINQEYRFMLVRKISLLGQSEVHVHNTGANERCACAHNVMTAGVSERCAAAHHSAAHHKFYSHFS